jgi:hypothetical protein
VADDILAAGEAAPAASTEAATGTPASRRDGRTPTDTEDLHGETDTGATGADDPRWLSETYLT